MNTWNAIFEYVSTLHASLQSVHFVVLGLVVCGESTPMYDTCTHVFPLAHTATAYMLIYFRFVVDACSELNLRQANCLSSIFYLKFRFYTQKFVFL